MSITVPLSLGSRSHQVHDPLADEQLPLGTMKGEDETSSEEALESKLQPGYEPALQTGHEPNFPALEGDVRPAYT